MEGKDERNEIKSTAHSKYRCQYHIVFAPKYRRKEIYGQLRHANLKYKYGSRNFWCRGYYVDTVGRNKKVIAEYIRAQLEEDYTLDQMSIKEYTDPFTGSKNRKA